MEDVIVVGSGASAVHAALPLVKAGFRVLMLDAGTTDDVYAPEIPAEDFETIRRTDDRQHRYFLGDDFEGIPLGPVRVGAQLTPPRQYISRGANEHAIDAGAFNGLHTLAAGGLAAGWGASSTPFTDDDMAGWPIGRADLQPHYEAVSRHVGICGDASDDLAPFFGPPLPLLPRARFDTNAIAIWKAYRNRRGRFAKHGFAMGHARLAMTTRKFRGRGPMRYFDMEFWADKDRAVYRPVYTLEELKRRANFRYVSGQIVRSYSEDPDGVTVETRPTDGGATQTWRARKLVLAAGTLGTTRIVLDSFGTTASVPLLANPYTYYPCVVYSRLGKPTHNQRHSLTQLLIYFDAHRDRERLVQAQIYSYRSLLTFKLAKESPLPYREAVALLRLLQSYFIIAGVHHEDRPTNTKKFMRNADGNFRIEYAASDGEKRERLDAERKLMRQFHALGCWPIKRIDPGDGSSIHYGGTLAMTHDDRPLTTDASGKLRGARGVYVADGSVFPHLPAKGLTFTLMANARRVGEAAVKDLRG